MKHENATWIEIKARLEQGKVIAILPIGAEEEHGPHLPLATDTIMAAGFAERLSVALDGMLLPAIPYGETWTTSGYPGTISLSFNTVLAIVLDIGSALAAQNVSALVIVNGHFGNQAPLEQASRQLQNQHHLPTMVLNYPGMEQAAAAICESKPAAPGFYHADEFETSFVLALKPEVVHMERANAEYPQFPTVFGSVPLLLDTFCKSGVFGDPRTASAEKGEQLLDALLPNALNVIQAFLQVNGL
ncbi:MAG: creatininase family protein [Chloroflexi bacterium]|nr:creatininase family protein [Chloroflexota bacterium]